ncbi:hypothetical protein LJC36_04990, partial [Desulfovibrio sp. OttesenSCG-928-C14]|nr:hypothetical protein [Desulfovibrio sp. OttesenSCG-928-C14]
MPVKIGPGVQMKKPTGSSRRPYLYVHQLSAFKANQGIASPDNLNRGTTPPKATRYGTTGK